MKITCFVVKFALCTATLLITHNGYSATTVPEVSPPPTKAAFKSKPKATAKSTTTTPPPVVVSPPRTTNSCVDPDPTDEWGAPTGGYATNLIAGGGCGGEGGGGGGGGGGGTTPPDPEPPAPPPPEPTTPPAPPCTPENNCVTLPTLPPITAPWPTCADLGNCYAPPPGPTPAPLPTPPNQQVCTADKNAYDALGCKGKKQVNISKLSDLEISAKYQFSLSWGLGVYQMAQSGFDNGVNDVAFSVALNASLASCQQEKVCVSEVFDYYGIKKLPTVIPFADIVSWILSYLRGAADGPKDYRDSDAYKAVSPWEFGAACARIEKRLADNGCPL